VSATPTPALRPSTTPVTAATTGHVGLNVGDVSRSIDFYCGVFGFEVLGQSTEPDRRHAFLGRDGQLVLTLWQQCSGRFGSDQPGLHHLAFDVPTLADVQAAVARLGELGVPMLYDRVLAHMPGMASGGIFFTDPDGIRIEICTGSGLESLPTLEHGAPSCGFF
jgi:lactoylglutathione lyase